MPKSPLRPFMLLAVALGLSLGLAVLARADVVLTKDGRRLEGTIVSVTKAEVVIETRIGRVTVARADVREIQRGNTPRQEFDARFEAARGDVAGLLALATWAKEQKLDSEARKCFRRVVELEPANEAANLGLGHVLHKGEWLTPKERDKRVHAEDVAAKRAAGLVEHEGRWVTPEDKARLEAGLVQVDGQWLTLAEAKARLGLGELDGEWVPLTAADAVRRMRERLAAVDARGDYALGADVAVAGPWPKEFLADIAAGLDRGRALFDAQFADAPRGVALFGGKAAEFYAWHRDSRPYLASIEPLSAITTTVGAPWREAVKDTHGWVFWDPYPVSSVRAGKRPEFHVAGHCYYHYGHVLLNRHRYDGRLLPAWFGEGYASLLEWWVHGCNTVVSKADSPTTVDGTTAKGREAPFARATLTRGDWQVELRRALEAKDPRLVPFDKLAQKSLGQLTPVDVAMAMGIVLWVERSGDGALARFHAALKASAPAPPEQELGRTADRVARYDAAFQAAVSLDSKAADRAWRLWFVELAPTPGAGDDRAGGPR